MLRSHTKDKNRRNYVDDTLEKLETENNSLAQLLEETRELYVSNEERLKQIEDDNVRLRRMLEDLGGKQENATPLFCDNQSAITLAHNPVFHGHSKHIELWHQFIREQVTKGEINLIYRKTKGQVTDMFTKALLKDKFKRLRSMLGLCSLNQGRVLEKLI